MTEDRGAKLLGSWMCLAMVVGLHDRFGHLPAARELAPYGANALIAWGVTVGGAMCLAFALSRLAARNPGRTLCICPVGVWPDARLSRHVDVLDLGFDRDRRIASRSAALCQQPVPGSLGSRPGRPPRDRRVWVFTVINIRGAIPAGEFQVLTTAIKLLPLVAVCGVALCALGNGAVPPRSAAPSPSVRAVSPALRAHHVSMRRLRMRHSARGAKPAIRSGSSLSRRWPERVDGPHLSCQLAPRRCCFCPMRLPRTARLALCRRDRPRAGSFGADRHRRLRHVSALGALNGCVLCSRARSRCSLARAGVFRAIWLGKTTRGWRTPVRAQIVSAIIASLLVWLRIHSELR